MGKREQRTPFAALLSKDTDKRRRLISSLIQELVAAHSEFRAFWLLYGSHSIVLSEDTDWLIGQAQLSSGEERKAYLDIFKKSLKKLKI